MSQAQCPDPLMAASASQRCPASGVNRIPVMEPVHPQRLPRTYRALTQRRARSVASQKRRQRNRSQRNQRNKMSRRQRNRSATGSPRRSRSRRRPRSADNVACNPRSTIFNFVSRMEVDILTASDFTRLDTRQQYMIARQGPLDDARRSEDLRTRLNLLREYQYCNSSVGPNLCRELAASCAEFRNWQRQ